MTDTTDLGTAAAGNKEVFALHLAQVLLGPSAVAQITPKKSNTSGFSLYWRSSLPSSNNHTHDSSNVKSKGEERQEGAAASSPNECVFIDITIHFQKQAASTSGTSVITNVQFGSFWKRSSAHLTRFLYAILGGDPDNELDSSRPSHWFSLVGDHFQHSCLHIDVTATPSPILARLLGRALLDWTPHAATWDEQHGPCLLLQYPEFDLPVPFPIDRTTGRNREDTTSIDSRNALEIVPPTIARGILLQHQQQSLFATTSMPVETDDTNKSWDLFLEWKQLQPACSLSLPAASRPPTGSTTEITVPVTSEDGATPSEEKSILGGAKRRRILLPKRTGVRMRPSPLGQRFV